MTPFSAPVLMSMDNQVTPTVIRTLRPLLLSVLEGFDFTTHRSFIPSSSRQALRTLPSGRCYLSASLFCVDSAIYQPYILLAYIRYYLQLKTDRSVGRSIMRVIDRSLLHMLTHLISPNQSQINRGQSASNFRLCRMTDSDQVAGMGRH